VARAALCLKVSQAGRGLVDRLIWRQIAVVLARWRLVAFISSTSSAHFKVKSRHRQKALLSQAFETFAWWRARRQRAALALVASAARETGLAIRALSKVLLAAWRSESNIAALRGNHLVKTFGQCAGKMLAIREDSCRKDHFAAWAALTAEELETTERAWEAEEAARRRVRDTIYTEKCVEG
jgi:hypothetical protein